MGAILNKWIPLTILITLVVSIIAAYSVPRPSPWTDEDRDGKYEYARFDAADWDGDGTSWIECTGAGAPHAQCEGDWDRIWDDVLDDWVALQNLMDLDGYEVYFPTGGYLMQGVNNGLCWNSTTETHDQTCGRYLRNDGTTETTIPGVVRIKRSNSTFTLQGGDRNGMEDGRWYGARMLDNRGNNACTDAFDGGNVPQDGGGGADNLCDYDGATTANGAFSAMAFGIGHGTNAWEVEDAGDSLMLTGVAGAAAAGAVSLSNMDIADTTADIDLTTGEHGNTAWYMACIQDSGSYVTNYVDVGDLAILDWADGTSNVNTQSMFIEIGRIGSTCSTTGTEVFFTRDVTLPDGVTTMEIPTPVMKRALAANSLTLYTDVRRDAIVANSKIRGGSFAPADWFGEGAHCNTVGEGNLLAGDTACDHGGVLGIDDGYLNVVENTSVLYCSIDGNTENKTCFDGYRNNIRATYQNNVIALGKLGSLFDVSGGFVMRNNVFENNTVVKGLVASGTGDRVITAVIKTFGEQSWVENIFRNNQCVGFDEVVGTVPNWSFTAGKLIEANSNNVKFIRNQFYGNSCHNIFLRGAQYAILDGNEFFGGMGLKFTLQCDIAQCKGIRFINNFFGHGGYQQDQLGDVHGYIETDASSPADYILGITFQNNFWELGEAVTAVGSQDNRGSVGLMLEDNDADNADIVFIGDQTNGVGLLYGKLNTTVLAPQPLHDGPFPRLLGVMIGANYVKDSAADTQTRATANTNCTTDTEGRMYVINDFECDGTALGASETGMICLCDGTNLNEIMGD